jgi:hypothetical protein
MTRIVYWNIEKFALNKIADPSNRRKSHSSISKALASWTRLNYITDHINFPTAVGLARIDILVVVEVTTAVDGVGRLVHGAGSAGALELLQEIRNETANFNWMLVPPLQTGGREAVAVYFNSANLDFTGPWRWPGGTGPSFDPAAANVATPGYAPPYAGSLPAAQQHLAARADGFTYGAHAALAGNLNFVPRTPYMVTFTERAPGGRDLTLFAIHSPADQTAPAFLRRLADSAEIVDNLGANEVRVIVGDFNVNLLNTVALNYTRNTAYDPLTVNGGYMLGIDRPVGVFPAPINGYLGYFATHLRDVDKASYWSTATANEFRPGYGFIGSSRIGNFYAIDNIFARYGPMGAIANVTVVNGVAGSPYNVGALLPAPPGGFYGMPIVMASVGEFSPAPPTAPPHSLARVAAFRAWYNYGYIRSTSDHMAIVADI